MPIYVAEDTSAYGKDAVVHYLKEDGIIQKQDNGLYSITNLGAILFAKDLNEFTRLSRKAMRVIQYKGINWLLIQRRNRLIKGMPYASRI